MAEDDAAHRTAPHGADWQVRVRALFEGLPIIGSLTSPNVRQSAGSFSLTSSLTPTAILDAPGLYRFHVLPTASTRTAGPLIPDSQPRSPRPDINCRCLRSTARLAQAWTMGTTEAPSPLAAATRFMEPERTSPAAKALSTVVARLGAGARPPS
jgi:hypothetical protein